MGSVFNTNTKCSLPSIPAIGGFDFISDCTVPDAPPPIYECPDMEFTCPLQVLLVRLAFLDLLVFLGLREQVSAQR